MNPLFLAPTTVMEVPPLQFVRLAGDTGYDGIGLRLYKSPHLPMHPVLGDAPLIRDMKREIAARDLRVLDIFTYYLRPETDVADFKASMELGAAFGAGYAVAQCDDPDPDRLRERFDAFCEMAGSLGLVAIVEFMPARTLATLEMAVALLDAAARTNTAILIDPLHLARACETPADVRRVDPARLPFAQFCDAVLEPGEPDPSHIGKPMSMGDRRAPGDGMLPVRELLEALPADIPLSIEVLARPGIDLAEAEAWAAMLRARTRAFIEG
jgi:sugar phosphate isomerase/epimerase